VATLPKLVSAEACKGSDRFANVVHENNDGRKIRLAEDVIALKNRESPDDDVANESDVDNETDL
jgi:hypothetical protein